VEIDQTEFLEGDDEVSPLQVQLAEKEVRASVLFKKWAPTISIPSGKPGAPPAELERHYTPAQLAEAWAVSVDKIRDLFRNEEGVLKIGERNPKHKQQYWTLRIPEQVAMRVHKRLSE
jgi:hypothetical protein